MMFRKECQDHDRHGFEALLTGEAHVALPKQVYC